MRRICGLVVIVQVASHAGIWRGVVIPVMAFRAIAGYEGMCPYEWKIVVVHGEQGRLPFGVGRMACLALVGQPEGAMVRVGRLVIISHMTTRTNIWC